jgi:hypothetical protein
LGAHPGRHVGVRTAFDFHTGRVHPGLALNAQSGLGVGVQIDDGREAIVGTLR